ncbi:MAG: methionine--tRNA ligase [Planctomycetes bacterium]|jgi:methionyl-tRNA synthetase|nr:methionine--tRNA ligase [Planctomycetota bacterium]
MTEAPAKFYVTTPIYYVNDRPHIGHVYTTTLADVMARYQRLRGRDVFFLTGTDEHAAKVVNAAEERGLSTMAWADANAAEFQNTFAKLGMTHDDFIRTSQDRHVRRVKACVQQLVDSGDVYEGEYEGWYDAGQEEYIPENKAKEYEYKSPFNARPLERRKERNFFFRLSAYADRLREHIESNPAFIQPEARRNEVLARIREGLNDTPISRTGSGGWGIQMPGDPEQTIYVWIDALFNYLTTVDTDQRQHYWPADHHLIAKDILWFHAIIWPAMLMALGRPLPGQVYAHSFWIAEGQKMSKSLGNFIDLEKIDRYVAEFGLDALRYYLVTQGPLGSTDADFAHDKFVDVYNADLANTLGNCAARVTNMIVRYFDGRVPRPGHPDRNTMDLRHACDGLVERLDEAYGAVALHNGVEIAMDLIRRIDAYIELTQPFKLAKDESKQDQLATILYTCAEALRIASLSLVAVLPDKIQALWLMLGQDYPLADGDLPRWSQWGQLQPGGPVSKGVLFPRHEGGDWLTR